MSWEAEGLWGVIITQGTNRVGFVVVPERGNCLVSIPSLTQLANHIVNLRHTRAKIFYQFFYGLHAL